MISKKIGIIAANNLRFSPYVFYYTKILEKMNVEYEVIVPNRNKQLENKTTFPVHILKWNSKKHSFFNYLSYSRQLQKFVDKRYDFLIVLTTVNAVFCCDWLIKKFKNRYIVDVRDYTYEHNRIYYFLESLVMQKSSLNIISSKKFETFLPPSKYFVCHNNNVPTETSYYKFEKNANKIIIGYVGAVAYKHQCERMIDLVSRDDRYEFHIYGTGVSENAVRDYTDKIGCERVKFFGAYDNSQKKDIIKKVDILFNAYGNGRPLVDTALSNKLYEAMYYHKLLITSPRTYMEEMGAEMAFSIDFSEENIMEKLWEWYHARNEIVIDNYASKMDKFFKKENEDTENRIFDILKRV